jgi:hypothetical protein
LVKNISMEVTVIHMNTTELPEIAESRKKIEAADSEEIEMALKYLYLICGRAAEVVTETYGNRNVYGAVGTDVHTTDYEDEVTGNRFEVAVFSVKTAKRRGNLRQIALPLDPHYEPWTQQILDYFQKKKNTAVFPFTRQYLWRLARPLFKDWNYPIEAYKVWAPMKLSGHKYEGEAAVETIESHTKPCALHWLRHLRATDLVSAPNYPRRFRFDVFELSYFGGWTIRGLLGLGAGSSSGAFQRYINLSWESYFPKLLRMKENQK